MGGGLECSQTLLVDIFILFQTFIAFKTSNLTVLLSTVYVGLERHLNNFTKMCS